ncbi:MAG: ABC transporter substrate-binding protein [Candidatus Thiodiazotropha endolucinida]|nr:ABC transporter substrate-binding protein [Candidatus Thiodiazotropha endolucinida]
MCLIRCCFVITAILFSGQSFSETLEKIKVASGGHIVHFLPFDVAVAKGFFTEEGLEPEITYLKGGTATAQALLAEQVDFSLNSIDHAFKAAVQGKTNLRMVALMNRLPGMVLVVDAKYRDRVENISDLKGMTLGVTSKGSATHMVLSYLLHKSGVQQQEVTIIKAGASTFPPALENGQIDGGIALEPFASILEERGKAFVLADLNNLETAKQVFGGPYNQAGILVRQEMIDKSPDVVHRFVNAISRSLQWMSQQSEEAIAEVLPPQVTGSDKARYILTLKKLREFYSPEGRIDPEGVGNVMLSMSVSGAIPENSGLDTGKFFTNQFVESYLSVGNTVSTPVDEMDEDIGEGGSNYLFFWGMGGLVLLMFFMMRRRKG